jgi:LacI family transcriptional regulator
MAPTIKDVAKKAKVSVATVSLVVHDNKRISTQTKKRVRKAIQDLNYHPTRSARGLVSKTSGNIGFIVTDDHFSRSEPFYTQIFLGTEFQARENEYYILLTTIPTEYNSKNPLPQFVRENNVDGIIMAGKVPICLLERLNKRKIPLVLIDYYPPDNGLPVVMIDNIEGGFKAANHLIDCHHVKIAFIGGDIDHPSIRERFQGYKMALEKAGLPFNSKLAAVNEEYPDRKNGYLTTKKILEEAPDVTAIFACNDAMAIGALQFLKGQGLSVPKDISLIGFDDVEADLSLDPPLTTMRVPKVDMGMEAVRLMVETFQRKSKIYRKVLVPAELVVRKSTCFRN